MITTTAASDASLHLLSSPLQLPCGRVVPNRFAKAPMEELQAPFGGGLPPPRLLRLYKTWAQGGWGMIITGNIAIDQTHLGTPFDVTFSKSISTIDMNRFKEYARSCQEAQVPSTSSQHTQPLAIVQLVHAGRQSARGFGRYPWQPSLAPSSVPMATAVGSIPWPLSSVLDWTLWGTCQAMTTRQVEELVGRFADSAEIVHSAGFDGVELHGSHGYMLAAFLSPKTNQRTDKYGGSAKNRFRIVEEIVLEIRARLPKEFVVGIKLNSADYVHGGLTEDDALCNVRWLYELGGVDFIEISGGNYENPSFLNSDFNADEEMAKLASPSTPQGAKAVPSPPIKASTQKREAFFSNFARRAAAALPPKSKDSPPRMALILTGGLRSRSGCLKALEEAGVDMCGIARASALDPDLPLKFLDGTLSDEEAVIPVPKMAEKPPSLLRYIPLKLLGAGWMTLYHAAQMGRIVKGLKVDPTIGTWGLLKGLT